MCGIAGIIKKNTSKDEKIVKSMTDSLIHRGPDGEGIEVFQNAILGHRRLSIIDHETGAQPMFNQTKNIAIVFNGEIYGYQNIKINLPQYTFKTSSDTEVIIALYETYGENFLDKLPGMFAFAIWDDNKQLLLAARDRFGEKPFYYAFGKNRELIFASEIKAIIATGLVEPIISKESIKHYLEKLYVNPNKTIYKNIYVLPAAHILKYGKEELSIYRYWNLPKTDNSISEKEAIFKFKELFKEAVKKQLVADVPVGAFISGGLDSTTVTAVATKLKPNLKTFSFGYEGEKNELKFAKIVSERYKTKHNELHDKKLNISNLILEMASIYDEPFADSSNISTYLISKLSKNHTKVVLSGDGGDELLGGYKWYRPFVNEEKKTFKNVLKQIVIQKKWPNIFNFKNDLFTRHQDRNKFFNDREIKKFGIDCKTKHQKPSWELSNTVNDAMKSDIENYMPGDILTKIDRASMANSIEIRAPFLDINFAEFVISLPYQLKLDSYQSKIIMRKAFEEIWPKEIINRPKLGFGAPVYAWIKKPEVQKLINDYLRDPNKKIFKFISFSRTKKYLNKDINYKNYKIWILLNLSVWMEKHEFKSK